jgi:hypothetical protein
MHTIHTTIDIAAPPAVVWEVLTDLDAYSEWNPFITNAQGIARESEELSIELTPPGGRTTRMKPIVTVADERHTFEWLGSVGMAGIFDGRHRFELEPTEAGTRLIQAEAFTGILARMVLRLIRARTESGFVDMNEALGSRSEQLADRLT